MATMVFDSRHGLQRGGNVYIRDAHGGNIGRRDADDRVVDGRVRIDVRNNVTNGWTGFVQVDNPGIANDRIFSFDSRNGRSTPQKLLRISGVAPNERIVLLNYTGPVRGIVNNSLLDYNRTPTVIEVPVPTNFAGHILRIAPGRPPRIQRLAPGWARPAGIAVNFAPVAVPKTPPGRHTSVAHGPIWDTIYWLRDNRNFARVAGRDNSLSAADIANFLAANGALNSSFTRGLHAAIAYPDVLRYIVLNTLPNMRTNNVGGQRANRIQALANLARRLSAEMSVIGMAGRLNGRPVTNTDFTTRLRSMNDVMAELFMLMGPVRFRSDAALASYRANKDRVGNILSRGEGMSPAQRRLLYNIRDGSVERSLAGLYDRVRISGNYTNLIKISMGNVQAHPRVMMDTLADEVGTIMQSIATRQSDLNRYILAIANARAAGISDVQIARAIGLAGWNNLTAVTRLIDQTVLVFQNQTAGYMREQAGRVNEVLQAYMSRKRQIGYEADVQKRQQIVGIVLTVATSLTFLGTAGSFAASVSALGVRQRDVTARSAVLAQVETATVNRSNASLIIRENQELDNLARLGVRNEAQQRRFSELLEKYPAGTRAATRKTATDVLAAQGQLQTSVDLAAIGTSQLNAWALSLAGGSSSTGGRALDLRVRNYAAIGFQKTEAPWESSNLTQREKDRLESLAKSSALYPVVRSILKSGLDAFGAAFGRLLSMQWQETEAGGTAGARNVIAGTLGGAYNSPAFNRRKRELWDAKFWADLNSPALVNRFRQGEISRFQGSVPNRVTQGQSWTAYMNYFHANASDVLGRDLGNALRGMFI